jgi:hypothetical protein
MITHILYHVPGRKVGCTRNLAKRMKRYPPGTTIEVLLELHDKTDQEAGNIEQKWNRRFGYGRQH